MKTLTEYISDVRLLTRLRYQTPLSDADIKRYINEAKDYVSQIVPFALIHSFYSSSPTQFVYYMPNDVLRVLSCRVYPYGGSFNTQTISANDTSIKVGDLSPFPSAGYVVVGSPPFWEIISYGGKDTNTNRLINCQRGQKGTTPLVIEANNPVRVWEEGADWVDLEPMTDVSVIKDGWWFRSNEFLSQTKTQPTQYAIRGNALLFDKPLSVKGFANIWLHCLISPPDMVSNSDYVYGLPDAFSSVISLYASMLVLKSLGGDDALRRYATLSEDFAVSVDRLQQYVEYALRGVSGQIKVSRGAK